MGYLFCGAYPNMRIEELKITNDYDENYFTHICNFLCEVYYNRYPEKVPKHLVVKTQKPVKNVFTDPATILPKEKEEPEILKSVLDISEPEDDDIEYISVLDFGKEEDDDKEYISVLDFSQPKEDNKPLISILDMPGSDECLADDDTTITFLSYDFKSSIKNLCSYAHISNMENESNYFPMVIIKKFDYYDDWNNILSSLTNYGLSCTLTKGMVFITPFDSWEVVTKSNIGDDQYVESKYDRHFDKAI